MSDQQQVQAADQIAQVLPKLTWDRFLANDGFRGMSFREQEEVKKFWLGSISPLLYPEAQNDPEQFRQLSSYVFSSNPTPIQESESAIFTPEALAGFRNWDDVENNPEYRKLKYGEQQQIKSTWFQKIAAYDPEFSQLPTENKEAFYERLIARPPGYGTDTWISKIRTGDESSDLFTHLPVESLWEGGMDPAEEVTAVGKFFTNLSGGIIRTAAALPTALMTMVNEDNPMTLMYRDVQKMRQWQNAVSDSANFLTEGLPGFVGAMGGILAGPYVGFERGAAELGGAAMSFIAPKMPAMVGRSTGAGFAGMVQGIGEAIASDEPWQSNLAFDASFGVAFEFGTRYLSALRLANKTAKAAGMPLKDFVRPSLDVADPSNLTRELQQVFEGNPAMAKLQQELHMVDSNGIRLETLHSRRGVDMVADVLDLEVRDVDNGIDILNRGNLIKHVEGPEQVRVDNAVNFMLHDPAVEEIWEKTLQYKNIMEAVETAPQVEIRRTQEIPEAARLHIADFFNHHGADGYWSRYASPHDQQLEMDRIVRTLRKNNPKKASDILESSGITFDGGGKSHEAAVAQLKVEAEQLYPESPYFMVNASAQGEPRIVDLQNVPVRLIEDPLMLNPTMHENVMVGDAKTIRNVITNLRKQRASAKRATTTTIKRGNGTIERIADDDIVELRMSVPDGSGSLHDVILHTQTLKQAEDLLTLGRTNKVEGLIDDLFEGTDPSVRKSFDDFAKAFRKNDLGKYTSDFAPYAFAVKMGREIDQFVGVLGGRYVVEDIRTGEYTKFDNLNNVYKYLEMKQPQFLPDLTPGVSRSAIEAMEPGGIPDPMKLNFEKVEIAPSRPMGITMGVQRNFAPTQYAVQYLENTQAGQWLRENGLSTTNMYNTVQDANRSVRAFISAKDAQIKKIVGKVKKKEAPWIYKYVEALDNPAERAKLGEAGAEYVTKDEVFEELVERFGRTHADELAETAVQVREYFDELFVRAGLNWGTFIQHYMPHIRAEASKRMSNMNSRLFDYTRGINIPEPDKKAFYEFARESDPRQIIFQDDVRQLMSQYTHMAARNAFLRPVMKDLRHSLNQLVDSVTVKGAIDNDYKQIVNYMGNFFDSVDGIHNQTDDQIRDATNNVVMRVAKFLDSRGKPDAEGNPSEHWQRRMATRSKDAVDTLITWSTGAHIAGRPFSAMRNLTQSLITGGSLLGADWWIDAVDKTLRPGSLARMESLGIITRNAMPVSGWAEMDMDGFLKKAVSFGMKPFKEADAINRAIAYTMGESRAQHAFDLLTQNKVKNAKQFSRVAGMKLYGKQNYNEMVDMINLAPDAITGRAALADRLGRLAVDRTQYLYNQFDQPQAFRHGIGRWAGQYTSWPNNFINLASNAIINPRSGMPVGDRVKFFVQLAGITGAISAGLYESGLNPTSFVPWEMADIGLGPQFDLAVSAVKGIRGDRESLFNVINNISRYFPYAYEGSALYRAYQALEDGDYTEMALHIMSAPLNYDVYPRRDKLIQPVLDDLYSAANKYSEAKQNTAQTFGKVKEAVENVFD